jgi:hypothetical protein
MRGLWLEQLNALLSPTPNDRSRKLTWTLQSLKYAPFRRYRVHAKPDRRLAWQLPTGLHDVVTNQGFDVWTPHITLANIIRGKSHDSSRDQYQLNLAATKSILQSFRVGGTHAARGISMGGPIPKQAALDWNFRSSLGEQITRQI